jgi:hypothetical protein
MTIGGFSGNDPTLTIPELHHLIESNVVRLFLLPASDVTLKERANLYAVMFPGKKGHLRGPKYTSGGSIYHWIATQCSPLPPPEWSSSPDALHQLGTDELFNCSVLVLSKPPHSSRAVSTASEFYAYMNGYEYR